MSSLPSIRKLKNECKLDRHMQFADDYGAGATFNDLEKYFDLLKALGPSYGYILQPKLLGVGVRESGTVMKQECKNNKEYIRGIRFEQARITK